MPGLVEMGQGLDGLVALQEVAEVEEELVVEVEEVAEAAGEEEVEEGAKEAKC